VTVDEAILARQGPLCLISDCGKPWTEKAHIWPSGMGGQPSTYRPDNLVGLCRYCHDVFDGRDMHGRQRMLRQLMEARRDMVELQRPVLQS
jgi:5-methylcytosine-specific restriction endonuclease McrA